VKSILQHTTPASGYTLFDYIAAVSDSSLLAKTSAASGMPRLRLRHSLAARISALVLLVLLAAGTSALLVLRQLRALQASFDLLTGVYVVFNEKLSAAHVQAVRIGEQVRRFNDERVSPERPPSRLDPVTAGTLSEGLELRTRLVREARSLLDEALADSERFGGVGETALAELRALDRAVTQLEDLVVWDEQVDPIDVLSEVRTQNEIHRGFNELETVSSIAIANLRAEVRDVQRRSERLTLALTFAVGLLAAIATLGVAWTLRPLRRLTLGVRKLGRGDWGQRIELAGRDPTAEDEVSELAREFNVMAEALEERERRLIQGERLAAAGQLAAQITHEIRNPLSSVALNVELLADELEHVGDTIRANPEAKQLLSRITDEIDRLTAVTEAYLGFARRPKPELVAIDLAAELGSLFDFMAEEHDKARISVTRQVPAEPVLVLADASQLRQAFLNLLRNAREAIAEARESRPEVPRGHIEIGLAQREGTVVVTVLDDGAGILLEDHQHARIFEAFFTRKTHGTGLGLSIVQQILHDHGGTIRVVSTGLSGTMFEVRLPACDSATTSVSSGRPVDSG